MSSVRCREKFEALVKPLWEQGKTDKEIAELLQANIRAVADARRRFQLEAELLEHEALRKPERIPQRKRVVLRDGTVCWDVSEFFGIWER